MTSGITMGECVEVWRELYLHVPSYPSSNRSIPPQIVVARYQVNPFPSPYRRLPDTDTGRQAVPPDTSRRI
jgi:hypothetical protein